MARRRKTKAISIACIFLIVAFQEVSNAAEWSASPSINLREDYDTNVLLTTLPHNSVASTSMVPRLDFGVASDIWQVSGVAELSRRRFPGHPELDSSAENLNLVSSYKTERSAWQLNAGSSRQSYLASQQINPNIGLFSANRDSDTKSINPSWTWSMTELTLLQLAYSQSDVSYVNGESIGLHDYRSSAVNVTLSHQLDVYTQIFFAPAYSIFRVPTTTFESKSNSYQLGATRTFSETMRGTFSAGRRNTSSEQEILICTLIFGPSCLQTAQEKSFSRDSSSLLSASLDKQFETVQLSAAASRSFDAVATGQQVRNDSVSLTLGKQLTSKLTGSLAVRANKFSAETGEVSGIDRKIYQVAPALRWQWTPELNLETSYTYTHLKLLSPANVATSNAAYLTLTYQWPKISISR